MRIPSLRTCAALLAAAALLAPAAAAARTADCSDDRRLYTTWSSLSAEDSRLFVAQFNAVKEVLLLAVSEQPVPPALVNRALQRTAAYDRFAGRAERKLLAIRPETASGREFRGFLLTYVRTIVRPSNGCMRKLLTSDTRAKLGAAIACMDRVQARRSRLSRELERSRLRLKASNRRC